MDIYCPNIFDDFNIKENFPLASCLLRQEAQSPVCKTCVPGRWFYWKYKKVILPIDGKSPFCKCGCLSMEKGSLSLLGLNKHFPLCEFCASFLIKKQGSRKLTAYDTQRIKFLSIVKGLTQQEIGGLFEKSQRTISMVLRK